MKLFSITLILGIYCCTIACKNNANKDTNIDTKEVTKQKKELLPPNPEEIIKDFDTWYAYHYNNIHLGQTFIGVDADEKKLTQTAFLNTLITGKFFVLHTNWKDSIPVYKLYKNTSTDTSIATVIKQSATHEMENYQMEGKDIPKFSFTDINGTTYSNAVTKGKVLILKCWFIHCVSCVKEFPELNKLVEAYNEDKNILFISLASDSKDALVSFLKDRPFKYATVPKSGNYVMESLGVQMFPTHLVIDTDGKIKKVVNKVADLRAFLKTFKPHNTI
jgi:peroxiredoxin